MRPSVKEMDIRELLLDVITVLGAVTVVITETLGLAGILTRPSVALAWLCVLIVMAMLWMGKRHLVKVRWPSFQGLSGTEMWMIASTVGIAAVIAVIAAAAPPNTYDSMTYHLARIEHWMQNRSLEHYPTSIHRQLTFCPFAEYAILQSMILTGGDRLANLVQWISMLGSWLAVSLIVQQLRAGRRGQLFAVLFSATLPMGILQGSSTQTDYVATLWITIFAWRVMAHRHDPSPMQSMWLGVVLGLAWLTKGHAYVYTFPFLVVWIWACLRRTKWPWAMLVLLVAVTLNLGYWSRNFSTFQSPFGPNQEGLVSIHATPNTVLASVLRNVSLHMGLPNPWNAPVDAFFRSADEKLDPASRARPPVFLVPALSLSEDQAANPIHLFTMAIAFVSWFFLFRKDHLLSAVAVCIIAMGLLFSMTVAWSPYHSRYHLPFFVLASVVLAVMLDRMQQPGWTFLLSAVLVFGAQPWIWSGHPRRIIGEQSLFKWPREQLYFVNRKHMDRVCQQFAQRLHAVGCSQVGLKIGSDDWEYPWWVFLKQANVPVRIEHLDEPQGLVSDYPRGPFKPCAVLAANTDEMQYHYDGREFQRVAQMDASGGPISLYLANDEP